MARLVYKAAEIHFELIQKMAAERATRILKIEIDNFVFYQKSKVGLIVGKVVEPLISDGLVILNTGCDCKIKLKADCVNLNYQKLSTSKNLDFIVQNSYELKNLRGVPVKQFTADSVTSYNENDKREIISF